MSYLKLLLKSKLKLLFMLAMLCGEIRLVDFNGAYEGDVGVV
jgi:hypothetical protein